VQTCLGPFSAQFSESTPPYKNIEIECENIRSLLRENVKKRCKDLQTVLEQDVKSKIKLTTTELKVFFILLLIDAFPLAWDLKSLILVPLEEIQKTLKID
jgi:hypothetical protein